jgi:hypothetical protein
MAKPGRSSILLIGLAALLALLCGGCMLAALNTERGSGHVIEKKFQVGDFHAIDLSGVGVLRITQGAPAALRIEAEDNVMPRLRAKVENSKLSLYFVDDMKRKNILPTKEIVYHVTVPQLDAVKVSGAGKVFCEELKGKTLTLDLSGASRVDMALHVDALNLVISGAGSSSFRGRADSQRVNISGTGKFLAKDLAGQTADITISGAGSGEVNVSEKLDVEISGAGSVRYKGDPHVTPEISGAGKVSRLDE